VKRSEKKEQRRRKMEIACLFLLLLAGIGIMAYSVIAQDEELLHDMEEYTELMEQVQAPEKSPSPDTVETVIPAITVAPYPSGSAKPTEYPLDILPGEQYWAAVERADKESADYIPENNVGAIIVIIPGTDAEAGKQEQQTSESGKLSLQEDGIHEQQLKPHITEQPAKLPEFSVPPSPSEQTVAPGSTPIANAPTVQPTVQPEPTVSPAPTPRIGKTGVDLDACKVQNSDFVAWLKIPGTKINYPVVWTDNVDYYLTHTFSGKESKIGTLFSLGKTDYKSPGRNIPIYGHHITTSGGNMFQPLMSYKKQSFWESHKTIYLDSLYHLGEYAVFAVINMQNGEWDPAAASFSGDQAFLNFLRRAKAQALYDTGIEVNADDHIITLITCDRSYHDKDGRLLVMAVEQ